MAKAGAASEGRDERAPNWAYIDQKLMEAYSYKIADLWELTLPEVSVHLEKLLPKVSEPQWFIDAWRKAKTGREKAMAMKRLMG
jgi:hypothetical protein